MMRDKKYKDDETTEKYKKINKKNKESIMEAKKKKHVLFPGSVPHGTMRKSIRPLYYLKKYLTIHVRMH